MPQPKIECPACKKLREQAEAQALEEFQRQQAEAAARRAEAEAYAESCLDQAVLDLTQSPLAERAQRHFRDQMKARLVPYIVIHQDHYRDRRRNLTIHLCRGIVGAKSRAAVQETVARHHGSLNLPQMFEAGLSPIQSLTPKWFSLGIIGVPAENASNLARELIPLLATPTVAPPKYVPTPLPI